jgi:hypothetical protein
MLDPGEEMEKLHNIFEAERLLQEEISRRGHLVLNSPNRGGSFHRETHDDGATTTVKCEWLVIQDTQGTLYIYKELGSGNGPGFQDLIYAEDLRTGRVVGRGDTELLMDAVDLLRQRMVLDDLADV